MTPFAQAILNDSAQPKLKRKFLTEPDVYTDVPSALLKAHSFEISAVVDLAADLIGRRSEKLRGGQIWPKQDSALAFLPAETTWIEYQHNTPVKHRAGLLLDQKDSIACCVFCREEKGVMGAYSELYFPLSGEENFGNWLGETDSSERVATKEDANLAIKTIYAFLAIINTPRVIGRRQHMPHAGLQRKLAGKHGMVGKFPLRAWTEIVLEVRPPEMDESEQETRLTGGKALHFVRAHLRIQNGQLVLVSPHWRGDPALGMVQSRYRLTPPKRAA